MKVFIVLLLDLIKSGYESTSGEQVARWFISTRWPAAAVVDPSQAYKCYIQSYILLLSSKSVQCFEIYMYSYMCFRLYCSSLILSALQPTVRSDLRKKSAQFLSILCFIHPISYSNFILIKWTCLRIAYFIDRVICVSDVLGLWFNSRHFCLSIFLSGWDLGWEPNSLPRSLVKAIGYLLD